MYRIVASVLLATLLAGCAEYKAPELKLIDLDKVLRVLNDVLVAEQRRVPDTTDSAGKGAAPAASADAEAQRLAARFTQALNTAALYPDALSVIEQGDGAFLGYSDINRNGRQDVEDELLFRTELDASGKRLLATDTQNGFIRDHSFSFAGLAAGMAISTLLDRQRAAGVDTSRFASAQVSPRNYLRARNPARQAGSSSRSGTGAIGGARIGSRSGGIHGGK